MEEPVEVPHALSGERVDRALSLLSGRSRAEVAELIASGKVTIGGRPVAARHRRVATGEVLLVLDVEDRSPAPLLGTAGITFTVVHEDESVIVLDKPAGLVVHPGAAHREDTLAAGLLYRYPDLAAAAADGAGTADRPGIVHRLDKDTSGLLVVARTRLAYDSLVAQLATRSMSRHYLTLVLGTMEADQGVIEAPIGRSRRDPTRMTVIVGGREARTRYTVKQRFYLPVPTTFLYCTLDTGRTHQIRVHLRAIGHPVAGDLRYGGRSPALGVSRPFLHAAELEFTHPRTGERLSFSSPLAPELAEVLGVLEGANSVS